MKKHLVISGRVQGVGFRYWLRNMAIEKNIFGWVKNKISGDVEALIIGNEKEVGDLIKLCKKGPSASKVNYVEIN
jgi:acylphosphatase